MRMFFNTCVAAALTAVGFVSSASAVTGGWTVHSVGAGSGTTLSTTTDAVNLLNNPTGSRFNTTSTSQTLNFELFDGYTQGWTLFNPRSAFPNMPSTTVTDGAAYDNFAIGATGTLKVNTSGTYTFDVDSDDGFLLKLGSYSTGYTGQRLAGDTIFQLNLAAGTYPIDLTYFQATGHAALQFFGGQGSYTTPQAIAAAPAGTFRLIGDSAATNLQMVQAVPEPASLSLLGLGCLGLLARRRSR